MLKPEGQPRIQASRPNANVIMGCELAERLRPEKPTANLQACNAAHRLIPKNLFRTLAPYYFEGRLFDLLQMNILKLRKDKAFQKFAAKHGVIKSDLLSGIDAINVPAPRATAPRQSTGPVPL